MCYQSISQAWHIIVIAVVIAVLPSPSHCRSFVITVTVLPSLLVTVLSLPSQCCLHHCIVIVLLLWCCCHGVAFIIASLWCCCRSFVVTVMVLPSSLHHCSIVVAVLSSLSQFHHCHCVVAVSCLLSWCHIHYHSVAVVVMVLHSLLWCCIHCCIVVVLNSLAQLGELWPPSPRCWGWGPWPSEPLAIEGDCMWWWQQQWHSLWLWGRLAECDGAGWAKGEWT